VTAVGRQPWLRAATLIGVLYFAAGYGSAALDPSVPDWGRFAWRLTSWAVCFAVFAAHVGYEHTRPNASPRLIALHSAAAVALGAFLIAAAATLHAAMTPAPSAPFGRFLLALAVWPAVTALPAFVAAFLISVIVARLMRKT
jgi:hypothetical protein